MLATGMAGASQNGGILSRCGRIGLGSARVSRVWFWRLAKTGFLGTSFASSDMNAQEKSAIARTRLPTRETRALRGPAACVNLLATGSEAR
jgi:hypothetical protein